ncbi:hypothetical protein MCUN1_002025 [Malassezia cuniculi]|uniref:Uncharacterized protein n=1 Tax=Malassezia cuniculi TaxID=948313 RepID=A0AAF0J6L3_9BASI|nr:hypothetical protein MCUN1_002025 [Malassezia cuniculi]
MSNPFLGLLTTLEDTAIYGYQLHMRVTILLMLQLRDEPLNDVDVQAVLRAVEGAYILYRSEPFAVLGGHLGDAHAPPVSPDTHPADRPIRSAAFDHRIATIAGWTGAQ